MLRWMPREAFAPGASPTEVARRHEISTGLLYTWRKKLSVAAVAPVTTSAGCPGFAEAVIVDDHCAAVPASGAALVIELARGRRIVTAGPGAAGGPAATMSVPRRGTLGCENEKAAPGLSSGAA